MTLTWAAPTNNGSASVSGYIVTPYVARVALPIRSYNAATTQTVTGLTNGTVYTFKVQAGNDAGLSVQSAASSPMAAGAPGPPTAVKVVKVAAGSLKVAFTAPANNGVTITSYTVTCTPSNGGVTTPRVRSDRTVRQREYHDQVSQARCRSPPTGDEVGVGATQRCLLGNTSRTRTVQGRPPTVDELVKLVEAAKAAEWQFGALVHLGTTTGARRGELAGLRWCDVDLVNASVRFVHQPDGARGFGPLKNKLARTVLLYEDTETMLRSHRDHCEQVAAECGDSLKDKSFVFSPTPGNTEAYRPDGLTWRFRQLAAAAGIYARLHDLRHAQATTLLASGISPAAVAARLGHSSRRGAECCERWRR